MSYRIFICYRRDDKELARSIEQRLVAEFGRDAVFLDVEDVGGGRDWKKRVEKALGDNPAVVTLITGKWNSRRGGTRRLLDNSDHIRFELETALDRNLPIIPVLYEPARWPKPDQLPQSLHALLRFNRVPFSNDRWDYDSGELIRALRGVLGEPPAAPQPETTVEAPSTSTPSFTRPDFRLPTTISRGMFQESEEEREARIAALEAEEARRQQARSEAIPFYARWEFWTAALATVALGFAAVMGGEALARVIASNWTSLPDTPIIAGVVMVITWAIARIGLGAAAYWYDPERGASVFYTRGIFGGYTLGIQDYEPIGFWAAFPFATAGSWVVARIVAWLPYNYWSWSYGLIFWLLLVAYSAVVLGGYSFFTLEETNDF